MRKIQIDEDVLKELYVKGLSDSAIAVHFKCNAETIRNNRKVLGLSSNQGVTVNGIHIKQSSIKQSTLESLVKQGLSDIKIGKILGYNHATIWQARKSYKIERESLKTTRTIEPSARQVEILIGHLLGDGSLRKDYINTTGSIAHGIDQKRYVEWKVRELSPLTGPVCIYERKTIDSRTGLYYKEASSHIKANPALNWIYDLFYKNGTKVITSEIVQYLTPLSLAVWYMDDGCKHQTTYSIATHCFDDNEVLKSMFRKFDIEISIHKSGATYIPAAYSKHFTDLIYNHTIPSMEYKIHQCHVTPLIQGKP